MFGSVRPSVSLFACVRSKQKHHDILNNKTERSVTKFVIHIIAVQPSGLETTLLISI